MKNKSLFTLMLLMGYVLTVTPKSANSGTTCGETIGDMSPVVQPMRCSDTAEEEEKEFTPITSLIPMYNLIFQ